MCFLFDDGDDDDDGMRQPGPSGDDTQTSMNVSHNARSSLRTSSRGDDRRPNPSRGRASRPPEVRGAGSRASGHSSRRASGGHSSPSMHRGLKAGFGWDVTHDGSLLEPYHERVSNVWGVLDLGGNDQVLPHNIQHTLICYHYFCHRRVVANNDESSRSYSRALWPRRNLRGASSPKYVLFSATLMCFLFVCVFFLMMMKMMMMACGSGALPEMRHGPR